RMRRRARVFRHALGHAPIGPLACLAPTSLDAFCVATVLLLPHHIEEARDRLDFRYLWGFHCLTPTDFSSGVGITRVLTLFVYLDARVYHVARSMLRWR